MFNRYYLFIVFSDYLIYMLVPEIDGLKSSTMNIHLFRFVVILVFTIYAYTALVDTYRLMVVLFSCRLKFTLELPLVEHAC